MNEFCVQQIYAKHSSRNVSRLISCGDNFNSIIHTHTEFIEANDDAIYGCRYYIVVFAVIFVAGIGIILSLLLSTHLEEDEGLILLTWLTLCFSTI